MTNLGNAIDPFHGLVAALTNSRLQSGQTIYLRAGTYYVDVDINITVSNITITNYPHEDVFICLRGVGTSPRVLTLTAANVRFHANAAGGMLRIGSEPTDRLSPARFTYPHEFGRVNVLGNASDQATFAGCYLHDLLSVAYQQGQGGILYRDCVLWNFGYAIQGGSSDGEYAYLQNVVGGAAKIIERAIFGLCYSIATQIYRESGNIGKFILKDVIALSMIWASSPTAIEGLTLDGCALWGIQPTLLGSGNDNNGTLTLKNTVSVATGSETDVGDWQTWDVQQNTFVALGSQLISVGDDNVGGSWDYNTYYDPNSRPVHFGTSLTYAQWQALGKDTNSTRIVAAPTVNQVVVKACSSGSMKAQIAVFNWQQLSSLSVDVSGLALVNGVSYRLRSAHNPLVDVSTFTYNGSGSITVTMTGRTVAIPTGDTVALGTIDPRFGAFVLEAA